MPFLRHTVDGKSTLTYVVTEEQRLFLKRHSIGLDKLFDASGMKRSRYGPLMVSGGYLVAYGVTVCLHGHELRNKRGTCIQCSPATIAYSARYHATQDVYLAQSKAGRLLKVGTSGNVADRFEQLNIHEYGGFDDWVLLESVTCANAGRVEQQVHVALDKFNVTADYGARPESCRELFKCKPSIALAALRRAAQATA